MLNIWITIEGMENEVLIKIKGLENQAINYISLFH